MHGIETKKWRSQKHSSGIGNQLGNADIADNGTMPDAGSVDFER